MAGGGVDCSGDCDENTFKILVATDNHLGYMERDGCRMNDSINSFEEILQIARDNEVDFVLLGGDLFHENKPSRKSLHGIIKLIRKYCFGDKPCSVAFLSDPVTNFGHTSFPIVNYEDPNLNISIPVFSIHGNHDDPAGQDNLCSLDLLHSAALVNYFGKVSNLENIELSPILMEKGSTKLALYGLGSIRDERLNRIFCQKNVKMLRPKEDKDDWFNVFVLHQNRAKHGPKNYIPEEFLDDFLDLVVWGHEHECKIDPSWNGVKNFYVTQPGSSIATSLSDGETREKHVGLLLIRGKNFKLKKIKLNTVRQFLMEDIVLQDTKIRPQDPNVVKKVEAYCTEVVEKLLIRAGQERMENKQTPMKPLIRLRIDYSSDDPDAPYELFNMHRFGQKFVDRVANPREIVHFHHKKKLTKNTDTKVAIDVKVESLDSARVEDMVKEYFLKAEKNMQLSLLTEQGISEAVKEFVLKEEKDAIPELVKYQLKKTQDFLVKKNTHEHDVEDEIFRFKEERNKDSEVIEQELKEAISQARSHKPDDNRIDAFDSDDDGIDINKNMIVDSISVERGKKTRGRGSRGGRGSSRSKVSESAAEKLASQDSLKLSRKVSKKNTETILLDEDDDTWDDGAIKKPTRITDMFNKISNASSSKVVGGIKRGRGKGFSFLDDDESDDAEDELFNKFVPKAKKRNIQ